MTTLVQVVSETRFADLIHAFTTNVAHVKTLFAAERNAAGEVAT